MIFSRLALFTVVGALPSLIAGTPLDAAAPPVYTTPSVPIGKAPGPNARTVGRQFEIDGNVGYFAGTNAWWLGYLLNDSDTEYAMSRIANTGYKTVRTWGFFGTNDPTTTDMQVYYQVLNSSLYSTGMGINYGPNGIHRLDVVVSLAEKYNLKIILALLNNWDGLGSISSYTSAFGGNSTSFFTDEVNQRVYRGYVEFIVNRYKSSSAIFAWELCNEPRCNNCDPSVIYNWAKETSEWIKSIDNTHMVTLGDEGWMCPPEGDDSYAYACGSGVDFVKNLEIETLDYGTFHLYPDSWGYNYTWGNEWILQHDQAGAAANKAVVLEEYGTPVNHTELERPWQQTVLKDTHLAADSIWQFGDDGEINMGDVNSIYYGTAEYQLLGFKHAAEMLAKPVQAKN